MKEKTQIWDGKAVLVYTASDEDAKVMSRPVQILLTEEAARRVSLAIASYAAIRKAWQHERILLPEVQELLDALNYTLVGDPGSERAYRIINAGKGMTPDGGFKAPQEEV
jgi:hypothetical protein